MMFLESYQQEYRRICNSVGSCEEPSLAQLEHEVRKTRPYGTMQRLMFMKTITWLIFDKGPGFTDHIKVDLMSPWSTRLMDSSSIPGLDIESYIESLKYFNRELGSPYP